MEDWVARAIEKWPNVPALFGWLGLDRRGRWTLKGETISRPQIIDTINANYAADEQGRWYFQNGPQRGYVALEAAPLILHVDGDGERLLTHTGHVVGRVTAVWIDEQGALLLSTEHGPGLLADIDLDWALARLRTRDGPIDEAELTAALALVDGSTTAISLALPERSLTVARLDFARWPQRLGFVREPRDLTIERQVR